MKMESKSIPAVGKFVRQRIALGSPFIMNHKLLFFLAFIACPLISHFSPAEELPARFQNSQYRVEFSSSYWNTLGFYGLTLGNYSLSGAFDLRLSGDYSLFRKTCTLKKTNDYQAVRQGDSLLLSSSRELTENGEDGEILARVKQQLLFAPEKIMVSFLIIPELDIPLNRNSRQSFSVYNGSSLNEYLGKTVEAWLPDNTVKSFVVRGQETVDRTAWMNRGLFKQVRIVDQNSSLFFVAEEGSLIRINYYGSGIEFNAVLASDNPDSRPLSLQKGHKYLLAYSILLQP